MGWAEQKLPWNRQRGINSWVGKTLNTIFPEDISERDPQIIQQPGFQSLEPTQAWTRSIPVCSNLIFYDPGVLMAQKSCTWRGWFVFKPEPGFSPSLHPQSSCSGGTDGESLVGQESLVLCHPAAQPLRLHPKTSNLVFLKAFSDDMCTWHLFAMYICH